MSRRGRVIRANLGLPSKMRRCFRCGDVVGKFVILENATGSESQPVCLRCLNIILNTPGVKVISDNVGKEM